MDFRGLCVRWAYMADFSDKSQFYKFGEKVPFH